MVSFRPILVLVAVLSLYGSARAATYYVDFDGGKDDAAGTSAGQAWKHCPGDAAAAGKAKSAVLAPGDTVLFKDFYHFLDDVGIGGRAGDDSDVHPGRHPELTYLSPYIYYG